MIAVDAMLPSGLREAQGVARLADRRGVSTGWIAETVADPFPAAGAALLASTDLRVGTAVAVAFARSPFVTAQASWELSRASGGRFTLGLGTQVKAHVERRFSAVWDRPVPRLREYVLALRALWRSFQTSEPPAFVGDFYRHTLVTPLFDPGPIEHPDVPVMLAGVNPAIVALAGECADGLIAHPLHSRRYLDEVVSPALGRGLERSGRARSDIEIVVPVWVVAGNTPGEVDAAREAVRARIAVYGSTRTYRRVFEVHGWDDVPARLHRLLADGRVDDMPTLVTDEMVESFAVHCAPDAVGPAVRERLGGVADRILLYDPMPPAVAAYGVERLAVALSAPAG